MHEEIQKPFDLKNGPLIRAALLRLGPEHHILVSTMHHIVSDGWSAELFIQRAGRALWRLFSRPGAVPKAPANAVFGFHHLATASDFGAIASRSNCHFGGELWQALPRCMIFRAIALGRSEPTYAGASQTLKLDQRDWLPTFSSLRDVSVNFFMLLAATFQVLLSKYGKQKDILIGIPVSGRNIVETENLIGLFVNTIVLRTSFSENPTFIEVLTQVRKKLLDAMSHQDAPFDLIVDTVRPARSLEL